MQGTIANTDYGWYGRLSTLHGLDEVNFWKPSARRSFHAEPFSPFLFRLGAPHRAICGFGFFARYSRLPDWLAWECFKKGNSYYPMRGQTLRCPKADPERPAARHLVWHNENRYLG